ncbi:MAG: NAD(P)/FAD-dependent oxidoreductase [Rhodovibrionaceae bacterium]
MSGGAQRIVVIGAGAAGIGAGLRLAEAEADFTILEARERIGGRAHSDSRFPAAFDLGCSWLWQGSRNPWVEHAGRLGFELVPDGHAPRLMFGGRPAAAKETARYHEERAAAFAAVEADREERAVSEVVQPAGPFARVLENSLGPWMMGAETSAVSTAEWGGAESRETDLLVPAGLGTLVATVGRDLPVELDTPVSAIDWSDSPIRIETPRGSLLAGKVIVTVPLGVLAAGGIAFTPALPDSVQEALAGLPMGLLAKLAYAFDADVFGFGATTHVMDAAAEDQHPLWIAAPYGAPMAMGLYGGDLAWELEAAGEAAALDWGLDALAGIFGGEIRKRVALARASRWGGDPWARGSYSVARPGCHSLRGALDAPFDERLFLAGEAWRSQGDAALVDGAYRSGWDTAGAALAAP